MYVCDICLLSQKILSSGKTLWSDTYDALTEGVVAFSIRQMVLK
jgi:hypothetical protein